LKLFQEWWGVEIKENNGGVNSNMVYLIYYKSICKCYSVSPPSPTIKKEEKNKETNK
jgi:hypothetical protein